MRKNREAIEGEIVNALAPSNKLTKTGSLVKRSQWQAPSDPLEQAWMLREYFRTGKHQLVLQCERTRQLDPDDYTSPVITCAPDNCDMPCFNCIVAILTGRKRWI
jgi:hypothetical protein